MRPFAFQNESIGDDLAWARISGGGGDEPADYCSRSGAEALKEKIEAYWRERGHKVMVALHNVGFHPAIRAARFDVRSDMVNGMPRSRPKTAASPKPELVEEDFGGHGFDEDSAFE